MEIKQKLMKVGYLAGIGLLQTETIFIYLRMKKPIFWLIFLL